VIDRSAVRADVRSVVQRWGYAPARDHTDRDLDAIVERAAGIVDGKCDQSTMSARFCIVTKTPDLTGATPLACVAARTLAFGVTVHAIHRPVRAPRDIVAALYPTASRHFAHRPERESVWRRLAERFDNEQFRGIFGRAYDRDLIVPAAEVMRANNLSTEELTEIWEAGRHPIGGEALKRQYGASAAALLLSGGDAYDWFRGSFPIGISRIGSGLTAFAMRDDRIAGGAPVIVVNGHVPGLATVFDARTCVLEAGIEVTGPQIADVRRWLVGDDNRPAKCERGTIRWDGHAGLLPLAGDTDITSRNNLVHCSDGLLAGLLELRRLVSDRHPANDLVTLRLAESGLTAAEINRIVLANPAVHTETTDGPLTDRTRHLSLAACIDEILTVAPPILGPANGYADGVSLDMIERFALVSHAADQRMTSAGLPPHHWLPDPDDDLEAVGHRVIAERQIALLVPAGGTGGRYTGYDRPEAARPPKALASDFRLYGRLVSSLDIRIANGRFWSGSDSDAVPVGVMASPTSISPLHDWRDGFTDAYGRSIELFQQHGVYRIDVGLIDGDVPRRWLDAVLRAPDGRPSLKPAGSIGLFTSFILSGLMAAWEQTGVRYLAAANGDDVGFRLDPRIVGHLERHPEIDVVIVGAPWGFSGKVADQPVRGDVSGWLVGGDGRRYPTGTTVTDLRYDQGSALRATHDGSLAIVDETWRPDQPALFNTTQIYVRMTALRRVIDGTGASDPVVAACRLTESQPLVTEEKPVTIDGGPARMARQLALPLHSILPLLGRCDVVATTRNADRKARSAYAPLKIAGDSAFSQLILDGIQTAHNELAFPA
jgi:hypothetical protein